MKNFLLVLIFVSLFLFCTCLYWFYQMSHNPVDHSCYEQSNKCSKISSWIAFLLQLFNLPFLDEPSPWTGGLWWNMHDRELVQNLEASSSPKRDGFVLLSVFPFPRCCRYLNLCLSLQPQYLNWMVSLPDPPIYLNSSCRSFGLGANSLKLASLCGPGGRCLGRPQLFCRQGFFTIHLTCHQHSPLLL